MAGSDPGVDRALDKLRARDLISAEEERVFRDAIGPAREVRAGRNIVAADAQLDHSTLLLDGFACRYKDLSAGQRQIMELHVSGDFVDLHSFMLKRLDHNIGAMTAVRVAPVAHEALREISETQPHLTRMLWFSTLLDAAIHRERILSVGRRGAEARIAHLFCEMSVRLEIAGLAADGRYRFPVTQADLADATGLTPVHVNRMLKKLRDDGLLTFRGGEAVIHDHERLARLAEFDANYLHLDHQPR